MSEPIPVEVQLPEKFERVQWFNRHHRRWDCGKFIPGGDGLPDDPLGWTSEACVLVDGPFRQDQDCAILNSLGVYSHWMPLPAPPN